MAKKAHKNKAAKKTAEELVEEYQKERAEAVNEKSPTSPESDPTPLEESPKVKRVEAAIATKTATVETDRPTMATYAKMCSIARPGTSEYESRMEKSPAS